MRSPSAHGPLYGWTFHQSHDQATVLFLVPQSISASDIDIRIACDHVSASIPNHPPIIQARLYGRVNTDTSTWRIADRDRARKRRSRSFARASPAPPSNSASGSADAPYTRTAHGEHRQIQSTVPSVSTSASSQASGSQVHVDSPPPSNSSLSASIVSLQSGSSYEVLSNSTPASLPAHSAGPATEWSSGSSDFGSSDSADASLNQSVVLSDPGDQRSYASRAVPSAERREHAGGVRRSQSSSDLASAPLSASAATRKSFGSQSVAPHTGPPEVRLVTLHLDKIDAGIWPLLVVGPAPVHMEAIPPRLHRLLASDLSRDVPITEAFISDSILKRRRREQERQQRSAAQIQLNQALEEALSAFEDGDRVLAAIRRGHATSSSQPSSSSHDQDHSRTSIDSDEDLGPNTSTLSINTIASDESATVLGSRVASRVASLAATTAGIERARAAALESSHDDTEREQDDETLEAWKELEVVARYNMDPTTLSLIGLQHANSDSLHRSSGLGGQLRRGPSSSSGIAAAFEYFARAWRAADVSLATERLVQDSLPLLPSTVQGVGHQDQSIVDVRLAEVLEPFLARSAMNLPDTGKVVASSLRERLHSHSYMSHRQRLVASLGGPKALARLYVSYARLHLPSLASNRSPLAFPYGQLTSPFVSGGQGVQHPAGNLRRRLSPNATSATSSRTPSIASLTFAGAEGGAASPAKSTRAPNSPTVAESSRMASPDHAAVQASAGQLDFSDFVVQADHIAASQPGPFYFFREACMLDNDVAAQISAGEWSEAVMLALQAEERRANEEQGLRHAEEMGSWAGNSESGGLTFESDSEARSATRPSRRYGQASSSSALSGLFNAWMGDEAAQTRQRHARRRKERRGKQTRKPKIDGPDAGVINFVSGAALLGVALAGSVAALGWWRRTSAALNSSA